MSAEIKMIFLGALCAALFVGYLGWRYHIESLGEAKIEAQDAKARAEQLQHDNDANAKALGDLKAQNDSLARQLSAVPAPVMRLCEPAPAPRSGPTGIVASSPGQTASPSGLGAPMQPGAVPGPDIGAGVQLLAAVAEQLADQNRALLERDAALSSQ